jgi:hypothetical protein
MFLAGARGDTASAPTRMDSDPAFCRLSEAAMNYPDGNRVILNDRVKLWQGCFGTVVSSIDDGQYSSEYPREEWEYLRKGILIKSDQAGLIHYIEPEPSFELIARHPRVAAL